jgi:hypothetical protein
VTLHVHDFKLLAKSVSPLPAAKTRHSKMGTVVRHAALEDPELRARQRYADLAVNPQVRETSASAPPSSKPCAISWTTKDSSRLRPPSCSRYMAARRRVRS